MGDLINILILASIYGLYASGFTLVFGLFDILNLAHAAVFAFGAVFTMFLVADLGLPLWAAAVTGVVGAGVVGVIVERVAFRPIRYRATTVWGKHIGPLMTSLGAATILAGLERAWFGIDPRHFPEESLLDSSLYLAGTRVSVVDVFSILLLLLAFGGIWAALNLTRWGLEVRAVAHAPNTVALFGIDVERRIIQVFAVASVLGGVAGLVWGLTFNTASPAIAAHVDIRGFAIIIIGGMGSVPGALLGSAFLAAAEVLSVRWLPSSWQFTVAFAALFLMLVIRPQGILGSRVESETGG